MEITREKMLEKLRAVEALYAGATTFGERQAAGFAKQRILDSLAQMKASTPVFVDWKFTIPDQWSRQLFFALCKRYNIRTFRRKGQHRQTVMAKVPNAEFVNRTLWPLFCDFSRALQNYLQEITNDVISEAVHFSDGNDDCEEEPEIMRLY